MTEEMNRAKNTFRLLPLADEYSLQNRIYVPEISRRIKCPAKFRQTFQQEISVF